MCLLNNAFPHFSSPSIANFLNSFVSTPSPFSLTQSKLSFPHYLFLLCVLLVTYFTSVNDVWVNLYCLCCFLACFRFCSTMIFFVRTRARARVCVPVGVCTYMLSLFLSLYSSPAYLLPYPLFFFSLSIIFLPLPPFGLGQAGRHASKKSTTTAAPRVLTFRYRRWLKYRASSLARYIWVKL